MIDSSVRTLMARIAKGLPIVITVAAAPFALAGCITTNWACDPGLETIVVSGTPPQASDAGVGDGGAPSDAGPRNCYEICRQAPEAMWQAQHADDEPTRQAFATIARDEARHAALSLDIDAWARTRLDDAACAQLDDARADALCALERELTQRECPAGLGLPEGDAAASLRHMVA